MVTPEPATLPNTPTSPTPESGIGSKVVSGLWKVSSWAGGEHWYQAQLRLRLAPQGPPGSSSLWPLVALPAPKHWLPMERVSPSVLLKREICHASLASHRSEGTQLHLAHSLVVQTGPGRGGDLPGHTQQQCLARGPCCLAVVILKESQRKPCVLPDGMFNPGVQGKRPRRVPCIIRGKPWAKNTFAELEAGGRVSSLSRGWGWLLMGQNRKTSRDIWNGVGHQANFELQHFSSHLMSHRVLTGMATGSGQGRDAGLREGPLWRE